MATERVSIREIEKRFLLADSDQPLAFVDSGVTKANS